jgi:hypothetical protein
MSGPWSSCIVRIRYAQVFRRFVYICSFLYLNPTCWQSFVIDFRGDFNKPCWKSFSISSLGAEGGQNRFFPLTLPASQKRSMRHHIYKFTGKWLIWKSTTEWIVEVMFSSERVPRVRSSCWMVGVQLQLSQLGDSLSQRAFCILL